MKLVLEGTNYEVGSMGVCAGLYTAPAVVENFKKFSKITEF